MAREGKEFAWLGKGVARLGKGFAWVWSVLDWTVLTYYAQVPLLVRDL